MSVLSGIRVLELAGIGPVPWCGMLLADMGADIIRIERPGTASDMQDSTKRGRTSIELDLKTQEGIETVLKLVAAADVLVEGMRPGSMERLGLSPATCLAANPALVFARVTGWGQNGPLAARAGHDINYIALSGALHAIGRERPVPPLNLVGDYGGGGAFLAIGLLAALLKARQSGHGDVVDVAMIDGASSLLTLQYGQLATGDWRDDRGSNALDGGAPWYDVYDTKDDRYVAVGAMEPQFYEQLLAGLQLTNDAVPNRADRANWPAIRKLFAARFAERTRDEWSAIFDETDACVSPVLSMTEAPCHPHNVARGTFVSWKGHPVPGAAPRFAGVARAIAGPIKHRTGEQALALWMCSRAG
ncbi:CaiB/BaiF CoA-transferase family protein [Polaromonas sp. C04]|uniref:CaiB/BaiF CoA transferase family protein n=1 Tax=Polaromonas sp. C04 TaxID=1945857 RepID=UPI00098598EC|nr:CaiB/BaiF CoA-transferase family protein [Polaromonas sp. C04]OOG51203.1 carnitine dehydratase [Polaromonas sp. C04]